MMAFSPFTSGYSSAWPSWQSPSFDRFDSFSTPSYYRRPTEPSGYRQPTYRSPYEGFGNDYFYPQRTTRSPFYRSSASQPRRSKNAWFDDDSDDEDSEGSYDAADPPCTCGKCDQRIASPRNKLRQHGAETRRSQQERRTSSRQAKPATVKNEMKESDRRRKFQTVQTAEPREKVVSPPSPATSASQVTPSESVTTSIAAEDRHSQPAPRVDDTAAVPADPSSASASQKDKRLANIKAIQGDLQDINDEVALFRGERSSKQYLRLEDLLTKALLRLDGIEADGDSEVRSARRAAVHAVQSTIDRLESSASTGEDTTKMGISNGSPAADDLAAEEGINLPDMNGSETSLTEDNCVEAEDTGNFVDQDEAEETEKMSVIDNSGEEAVAQDNCVEAEDTANFVDQDEAEESEKLSVVDNSGEEAVAQVGVDRIDSVNDQTDM